MESAKPINEDELINKMIAGVEVSDRRYHLILYPKVFTGKEAVSWMIKEGVALNIDDAVAVGKILENNGHFKHVTGDHPFCNEDYFFRFFIHNEKGSKEKKVDGQELSWGDFVDKTGENITGMSPEIAVPLRDGGIATPKDVMVSPLDKWNVQLLDLVHPAKWKDPVTTDNYNMVIIGAGAGGLVTAASCAGVGAKVAIIEEHLLGGDCLNVGCVPSKALIKAARRVAEVRDAAEFGVKVKGYEVDFGLIMERLRRLRSEIAPNDSADRFSKLGVDVYFGRGKFTGPNSLEINGKTITFSKATIATGGRAYCPNIPGLKESNFLTNNNLFNLTVLPKRFGVLGAGPIGLEMAQCFQRFGSEVTVFNNAAKILPREDEDASAIVNEALKKDGIMLINSCTVSRISGGEKTVSGRNPIKIFYTANGGGESMIEVDELLVATGRAANVEDLGLESAGVEHDRLIKINSFLQTSNPNIYAVGDCCSRYQFTHCADFMARMVVRNALFFGGGKFESLLIPWATYTEPEVAHVGLYESDMVSKGIDFDTYKKDFIHNDRAILEGETNGFVKIHCKKGTDEILGATIVSGDAGNMISEITVAMQNSVGLGKIAVSIHPYPTKSEAIRQCGDLYNKTRLTPTVKNLLRNITYFRR